MQNKLDKPAEGLGITAVERDTGLSKDILRVWERRYGFPLPARDHNGDRLYPPEQVDKLRLIRRLLDLGRRPSSVVTLDAGTLAAMLDSAATALAPEGDPDSATHDRLIELLRLQRSAELRIALHQLLLKHGLQRFVCDTVAPLNIRVGQAWMRGDIDVAEEHLYTEQVQNVLRSAIGAQAATDGRPRILLTTLPDELHALGLLMAEATLVPEGAVCVSLGTQTPITDICNAASSGDFDIVALSCSAAFPARSAIDGLNTLRAALPAAIELWAGGQAVQGKAARLPGVRVIADLPDALVALAEWRSAQRAAISRPRA
ncbi:MerR family transcriptional regulator [Pseudothauera lacus]|uniref:MerR family transcriptional regulator n=1 Tax=Pseudothauera lacus TaxID=2136175 RepID=A0A2T4IG47_9RHOO|nr:MerR family transcriptional regulator [Pseudothauera lacus]PTD96738.1 MerR family transcriptional regulator [Pseudothauera lacus]